MSKGQINIEFLAAAFVYLAALGTLITIGSDVLPQFSDNMEKASLNLEAQQVSTEILTHPGRHSHAGGGTNWQRNIDTVNSMESFGLSNSSDPFLVVEREKINALESFEGGGPKNDFNYSQFKELANADNQYRIKFIWKPIVDTSDSFTRTEVQPLNDTMLGYWPMDQVSGPVQDVSGNGNDGTNNNAERGVPGVFATNSTRFNESGRYVEAPNTEAFEGGPDTKLTAGAWIKPQMESLSGSEHAIIEKEWNDTAGDWGLMLRESCPGHPQGKCIGSPPYISFYSQHQNSDMYSLNYGPVETESWQHTMFRFDQQNEDLELYLNGERVAKDQNFGVISASTPGNVYIGNEVHDNSNVEGKHFNGSIDEVRVYNGTIDPESIRRLYDTGPPHIKEPDSDYYSFSENEVHFGYEEMNGSVYKFLVTAHNNRYNTTYVSKDWDFRGHAQIGVRDSINLYGGIYTVGTIQNNDEDRGSTVVLTQQLNTFGSSIDSDSQVIRMDRYVSMEGEPMRVEVLTW